MKIGIGVEQMNVRQLAAYCGGRTVGDEPYVDSEAKWICTDSREATNAETLFAVTVGERVDAHAYMRKAYDGGCRLFLFGGQRCTVKIGFCKTTAYRTRRNKNNLFSAVMKVGKNRNELMYLSDIDISRCVRQRRCTYLYDNAFYIFGRNFHFLSPVFKNCIYILVK